MDCLVQYELTLQESLDPFYVGLEHQQIIG